MTARMRNFLKGKNVNLAIFEGILQQEINEAIEQYKKDEAEKAKAAAMKATPKTTTVKKEVVEEIKDEPESIAQAMSK